MITGSPYGFRMMFGHLQAPWASDPAGRPIVPLDQSWHIKEDGDLSPSSYAQWLDSRSRFDRQSSQNAYQFNKQHELAEARLGLDRDAHNRDWGRRDERWGMFKEALLGKGPVSEFMGSSYGLGLPGSQYSPPAQQAQPPRKQNRTSFSSMFSDGPRGTVGPGVGAGARK